MSGEAFGRIFGTVLLAIMMWDTLKFGLKWEDVQTEQKTTLGIWVLFLSFLANALLGPLFSVFVMFTYQGWLIYKVVRFFRKHIKSFKKAVKENPSQPVIGPSPEEIRRQEIEQAMLEEMQQVITLGEAQGIPKSIIEAELENVRDKFEEIV